MTKASRCITFAVLASAASVSIPQAHADILKCKGHLVFADSLARAVTLMADPEVGSVTTRDCRKYPELAPFCAGTIRDAKSHQFVFGAAVSPENSRVRIDLIRTNAAVSTDTVLMAKPHATFLGRCEPTRRRKS